MYKFSMIQPQKFIPIYSSLFNLFFDLLEDFFMRIDEHLVHDVVMFLDGILKIFETAANFAFCFDGICCAEFVFTGLACAFEQH